MAFDWLQFLEANQIHYVTSGPNVSSGHVAVKCPMCGAADPSQHMAISLSGGGWKCWRAADHRGKSPAYLVALLLNITLERARDMVGDAVFIPDDFMGTVMKNLNPPKEAPRHRLEMPREFKPIEDRYYAQSAIDYLMGPSRRFTYKQVMKMTDIYDLRCCTTGPYRHRIIFPVIANGELKSWTARTTHPDVELRYKTLSSVEGKEEHTAAGPITEFMLWGDDIRANVDKADTLILVEGPFDALKLRVEGARLGVESTCCFTASPSDTQMDMLYDIAPRYARRYILFDKETLHTALRVQARLGPLGFGVLYVPEHRKDPGEMTRDDIRAVLP